MSTYQYWFQGCYLAGFGKNSNPYLLHTSKILVLLPNSSTYFLPNLKQNLSLFFFKKSYISFDIYSEETFISKFHQLNNDSVILTNPFLFHCDLFLLLNFAATWELINFDLNWLWFIHKLLGNIFGPFQTIHKSNRKILPSNIDFFLFRPT